LKIRRLSSNYSILFVGLFALLTSFSNPIRLEAAASLIDLHDFNPGNAGSYPFESMIQATDGNLYGITYYGGATGSGINGGGTVFRIVPGGTLTILHSFSTNDGNGSNPRGIMQANDGNFYGVTNDGGAHNYGTVFKMTPTGTTTVLHSFAGGATDGAYPYGGLVQAADGNLYGTTGYGGPAATGMSNGDGAVFKITTAGVETVLYFFSTTDGANGSVPEAALIQATDGNLYGTTAAGTGAANTGTIFKITTGGTLTTIKTFSGVGATDGYYPDTGLVQAVDGNIYGTTDQGGPGGHGTIYKLTMAGVYSVIHGFNGTDGSSAFGPLMQAGDGKLYGTTEFGGANGDGTIYQITTAGVFTSLHSFGDTDGWNPKAGLVQGADGSLYGTTTAGNANAGIIFKTTTGGTFTTVHAFTYTDGANSTADLVQGTDGNFYGTTQYGGATGWGSIFKSTPDGAVTVLHSFNKTDGSQPLARLVQGVDGNFYGTTSADGPTNQGTAFKITPAGVFTTLHSFDTSVEGGQPKAALIQGIDGNFYGTTVYGGTNHIGTIYKMTPAGVVTVLHNCSNAVTDGYYAGTGLTLAGDGNFYGVMGNGGANANGIVYQITPGGTFALLHSFNTTDGAYPECDLALGDDGNLYGTTEAGGTNNDGTVFNITTAGVLTTLHSFTAGVDGYFAFAGVIKAADGSFYGRTAYGGAHSSGILFNYTTGGTFTTLVSVPGSPSGNSGHADVIQGSDGSFYGTTNAAGAYGEGSIFRMVLDDNPHNVLLLQNANTNQAMLWNVWNATVTNSAVVSVTPPAGWKAASLGDFNGDGHADLLLQNQSTGKLAIWYLNGGQVTSTTLVAAVPGSAWKVAGIGDFNSDGQPDILFQNSSTSQLAVWHMNGASLNTGAVLALKPGSGWNAIGVGDFNADGHPDILFQNTSTRKLIVWYMNDTTRTGYAAFASVPAPGWPLGSVVNTYNQGYPDLVFQSPGTHNPVAWNMHNGTLTGSGTLTSALGSGWNIVGPR